MWYYLYIYSINSKKGNVFFSGNSIKFKKRIERLLIPYIIWPLIFFVIDNVLGITKITFNDLKLQLICGRQFIFPLWYLFSILFLTILFFILSRLFQNNFLFIIQIMSIIIYNIQYSYYYYYILDKYNDNVKLPIISTLNMFPLSTFGLIFSSLKLIHIFSTYRKKTIFFSFIFIFCIFRYDIFYDLGGFKGVSFLFSSSSFFVGFYLLNLDNINPFLQKAIKQITSYTNGIYCLHMKIDSFLKNKFRIDGTFRNIIILYFLIHFISFIGIKIFGKTKLKYLFIWNAFQQYTKINILLY